MQEFPWGNLITAASTLLAVFVTFKLNRSSSRDERLLELRRAAYGAVIAALRRIELALRPSQEALTSPADLDPKALLYGEDSPSRVETRIEELMVVYAEHTLVFSPAFASACDFSISALDRYNATAPAEYHRQLQDILREQRARLEALAQSELRLSDRARRRL